MTNQTLSKIGGVVALVSSFLAISTPVSAISFNSEVGSYNIPDGDSAGVSVPIVISEQGNISSINSITISGFTHPFYRDLTAIFSNGATDITLFLQSQPFDNPDLDLSGDYNFANTGENWYKQNSNPVPNTTYASFQSLDAFNGAALNNTWTLKITDVFAIDAGSFTRWSFDVTTGTTPVPFNFSPELSLTALGLAFVVKQKLLKKLK